MSTSCKASTPSSSGLRVTRHSCLKVKSSHPIPCEYTCYEERLANKAHVAALTSSASETVLTFFHGSKASRSPCSLCASCGLKTRMSLTRVEGLTDDACLPLRKLPIVRMWGAFSESRLHPKTSSAASVTVCAFSYPRLWEF